MDLNDRVVLITGASMGIGEALAHAYAAENARVVLAARSADRLQQVAAKLPAGRALAVPVDVTDRRALPDLVDRTLKSFGRVDILVNNAGIGLYAPVADMEEQHFRKLFELNVFAPIHLIQTVLPQMKFRREGLIVNVASVVGHVALPLMGAYSASKFALRAFTDSLRVELKPFGIGVLGVYPGTIRTPFSENALAGAPQRFRGRPGGISAEQCARAIVAACKKDKRDLVVPASMHAFIGVCRWFPRLADRVLGRLFRDAVKP